VFNCLGTATCRLRDDICRLSYQSCITQRWETATQSACTALNSTCSVSNAPNCTGEYVCSYCPGGSSSCVIVPGVTSESECSSLVACELKDGSIEYVTEEQCSQTFGTCTSDCIGQSCRSFDGLSGVCVLGNVSGTSCVSNGGLWYQNTTCILTSILNQYGCSVVSSVSHPTTWQTCGSLDPANCVPSQFSSAQKYMRCFVDEYRDCSNSEECLLTGNCTDRNYVRQVLSTDVSTGIIVKYGLCVRSGYYDATLPNKAPFCNSVYNFLEGFAGCNNPNANEADCPSFEVITVEYDEWVWGVYLHPAKSKEECMVRTNGRYGCRLPTGERMWFWNETECDCWGGDPDYLWRYFQQFFFHFLDIFYLCFLIECMIIRWYPGEWISGQPRPLTWMPATPVHPYVWRPSLSFIDLENYVTATTEAVFLKKIVSQTICQTNVINSALSTLACDCLAVDSERSMEKHYVSVFKINVFFF